MVNPLGKSPNNITEDDLKECLGDFAESWVVEYKGPDKWDDNVGIAKSIASFANTYGGWLFIGINADDDNKPDLDNLVGVAKECGMPERLYQIAASHLSPGPYFLCHPVELANGNVVVANCINESPSPPHIHVQSGVIPMRSGNTTDPVEPLRDRAKLDQLHGKADRNREDVEVLLAHHEHGRLVISYVAGSVGKALHLPGHGGWWVFLVYPASAIPGLLPYVVHPNFPRYDWPGRDQMPFYAGGISCPSRFTQYGVCVNHGEDKGYYLDVFGHIAVGGIVDSVNEVSAKCDIYERGCDIAGLLETVQAIYQNAAYWGQVEIDLRVSRLPGALGVEPRSWSVRRTTSVGDLSSLDTDSIKDEIARAISW